jgi:hypothetical protein
MELAVGRRSRFARRDDYVPRVKQVDARHRVLHAVRGLGPNLPSLDGASTGATCLPFSRKRSSVLVVRHGGTTPASSSSARRLPNRRARRDVPTGSRPTSVPIFRDAVKRLATRGNR